MKKEVLSLFLAGVLLLSIGFASADSAPLKNCRPSVELINQDPYPANPGEYVKVVFQIDGLNNPECEKVSFELKDSFPFSLDPGEVRTYDFIGDAYVRKFSSAAMAPYELRVNKDAIDGENEIEAVLEYVDASSGNVISEVQEFEINVNGVKVDFEVSVKDFDSATNSLTFEILNTREDDVVALTVDVPKQDTIVVKGASRNIIGDLDASDDTTFKFEATPHDGEIELTIAYTDSINERREMIKKVYYDSSYFTGRKGDEVQPKSTYYYLFYALFLLVIIFWIRGWFKRRKKKKEERKRK
ncbi:MAG: hypothetical protein ABH864_01625 [archaeon]